MEFRLLAIKIEYSYTYQIAKRDEKYFIVFPEEGYRL